MDLRTHGWVLERSWPKLFDLYTKDGEARAELSPELRTIENALKRGHSTDDYGALKFERALFLSTVIFAGKQEGGACSSFGFQYLRQLIADDLAECLGPVTFELLSAKTPERAESAAESAVSLMKRATGGLVRMNYPKAGRGNDKPTSKALLAILCATVLCASLRRLPTKTEVRATLEEMGVSFARSHDAPGRWHELFRRAGLAALED